MANENVKKIYEALVVTTAELRAANKANDQLAIREAEEKLILCLINLHDVERYAFWAESLLDSIDRNVSEKLSLDYVIQYASKLCELIEADLKQDKAAKIDEIKENAKSACANLFDNVQTKLKMAQTVAKEEAPKYTAVAKDVKDAIMRKGPNYVAEATKAFKNVSQKFGDTINSLLDEDDNDDEI